MRIKAYGKPPTKWGGIKCDRCRESDGLETRLHPDGDGWYFWCNHCKRPVSFDEWFADL